MLPCDSGIPLSTSYHEENLQLTLTLTCLYLENLEIDQMKFPNRKRKNVHQRKYIHRVIVVYKYKNKLGNGLSNFTCK